MVTAGTVLGKIRRKLGDPPREVGSRLEGRHRIRRPEWLEKGEPLSEVLRDRRRLLEHGEVVWAHVVHAHPRLFKKGKDTYPAALVYGLDRWLDDRVSTLESVATSLYRLKHSRVEDPGLEKIAAAITDQHTFLLAESVPPGVYKGIFDAPALTYSSTLIDPRHLPKRHFVMSWFPILVAPAVSRSCLLLDHRYWPGFLKQFWKADWE